MKRNWTRDAVEAQGPTTEVPVLAEIVDLNKDTIYDAIRRGEWTMTRVLRIGRRIKIPTVDIVTYLFGPAETTPAPSRDEGEQQCASGPENASSAAFTSHTQCGCTPADLGAVHRLRGA